MKKIMKLCILSMLIFCMSITVCATGSGNIDSGGGGMGSGSNSNFWSPGNEGVRVTVVDSETMLPVTTPIDLTNKHPSTTIYNFGKVSKITYCTGRSLNPQKGGFTTYTPKQPLPLIISTTGRNNIEAIKSYFTDEGILRYIATIVGMDYNVMVSGDYKILLEPFAFYTFQGVMIATTATEAALYDNQVGGLLRRWMVSLTHKNLPLSMFLEVSDLLFPAWGGSTTTAASNNQIVANLGMGIVRFTERAEPPEIVTYDYEYRVNTEVITSVRVSGGESTPDNPTIVTFDINGRKYNVGNVYYPEDMSQLAWVKWTTPSEPQTMTIKVTANGDGGVEQANINVNIVDLDENEPPNPTADDTNRSFTIPSGVPSHSINESARWSVWTPSWKSYWIWHYTEDGKGFWYDHGTWNYTLNQHSASLNATMDITNDSNNPTATSTTLKSGYGINEQVEVKISTSQSSAVSGTPNGISYFPEFHYETYWRVLERTKVGLVANLEFQSNQYSTYGNRTHFTPIWYPDGSYKVSTKIFDTWTPVGMLSTSKTDRLIISGNLWEDWHIGPIN